MYLVKVFVGDSEIEGRRVFAAEDIPKGAITWKFDSHFDYTLSKEEFELLDPKKRENLLRIAYLSPTTDRWVYPPEDDPSSFTNHSKSNNQTVFADRSVSEEPFFRSNRDIKKGEELTVNYGEFDNRSVDLLEEGV